MTCPTQHNRINTRAFFWALILAPIASGVGFCFLIAPIIAPLLGGPAYLLLGGPAYWLTLRWVKDTKNCTVQLLLAGLFANCGTFYLATATAMWRTRGF